MDEKINRILSPQERKVYDWLAETGGSTVREIFIYLNINSPTKILSNLDKLGLIDKQDAFRTNADGQKVWFKRYSLRRKK